MRSNTTERDCFEVSDDDNCLENDDEIGVNEEYPSSAHKLRIKSEIHTLQLKSLSDFEENQSILHRSRPPKRNGSEVVFRNIAKATIPPQEKEMLKSTQDVYFKTSASSNEGFRSQYQSTNEAISIFSPKEGHGTDRSASGKSLQLNLLRSNIDNRDSLLTNVKFLYDQNTDRTKKRTEQMKKLRSQKSSEANIEVTQSNDNEDVVIKIIPMKAELTQTEDVKENAEEKTSENNENAEVNISDLDCSVEIKSDNSDNVYSLSNSHSHRSFVPITNALVTKAIKEENATPSYLLALSQYEANNNEVEEMSQGEKLNIAENYDSLEKDANHNLKAVRSASTKEPKHIRLPSGKNYLISSVIEEEVNETYTDSEMSTRKKSYMFSKSKYESSEKKLSLRTSRDVVVDKNVESSFFNKIKAVAIHLENEIGSSHAPSKSEIPAAFKSRPVSHKIAKSEVFNLQIDLKKTLDEIYKKKNEEDEQVKQRVENKKKELIDKFFNKSSDICNVFFQNQLGNKNQNKFFINLKPDETANAPLDSKQSPSQTREKYYQENSDKSKKVIKLDENELSKVSKISKDEFDMKFFSPIKKDLSGISGEEPIVYNETQNSLKNAAPLNYKSIKDKYKKERKKSSIFKSEDLRISKAEGNNLYVSPKLSNNNGIISQSNNNQMMNKIKDNTQSSIIDQCSYININNNINICSPISVNSIKNDIIEYTITNDKKLSDKTLTNPFDFVKNNNTSNNEISSSSHKPHCINLNLTISNKTDDNNNIMIKRNLFNDLSEQAAVNNNKKKSEMSITNEVKLDIIPEVKKRTERNKRISMELLKNANKIGLCSNLHQNNLKHTKTSSVNLNIFNNYTKNISSALINFHNGTVNNNKNNNVINYPSYKSNFISNLKKGRSSSGSIKSSKMESSSQNTRLNTNTSHCNNTSPFNKISDRCSKASESKDRVKISPSVRINTPLNNKIRNAKTTADLKQIITNSGNKQNKSADKLKVITKVQSKDTPSISNNLQNNKIPKLPKKKPSSYRTNSGISFSNLFAGKYSNKLKIFEAIRFLNFQKTPTTDHHKVALEKLANSKGMHFILLVEEDKQLYNFKGVYESNSDKHFLIKTYGTITSPNVINYTQVSRQYKLNNKTLQELKSETQKYFSNLRSDYLAPECIAVALSSKD